ncbi:MAG: L-serine ammonia-lyase, iron-sulfur-dependent, subunit alpha [Clostridiaceae bacterium]|nr:L-serine ammonia-lyase, iron-sulfur-dependent, subunit alpha [Clostridiaceae bacterium]
MVHKLHEIINLCEREGIALHEYFLRTEIKEIGGTEEEILRHMEQNLSVMEQAVQQGIEGVKSRSGMTGGDAKLLAEYLQSGNALSGSIYTRAMVYATAVNEVNAAMGVICATPTAGSSGTLPGVLFAIRSHLKLSRREQLNFLITAAGCGIVIGNQASISGAEGGCQAEVGSAAAMSAAATVEACGGSPSQSGHALAIALKNLLGLSCDPVAGLVEVPCIKRNTAGVVIAISSAEMSLAGVKSRIPVDEVIDTMGKIGRAMPPALRETALGGLAQTETGLEMARRLEETGHTDL